MRHHQTREARLHHQVGTIATYVLRAEITPKKTYNTIPYLQPHKYTIGATLKRAAFCALLFMALTPISQLYHVTGSARDSGDVIGVWILLILTCLGLA